MATYAALVSLMNIIHNIQHHPSPPITLDKELVDSITQHITLLQDFLHAYNPPPANDDKEAIADPLEMRIANAAYAAEDAIEFHIVDSISIQQKQQRSTRNDENIRSINLCSDSLKLVIQEMDSIKKVVAGSAHTEDKKKQLVVHDQVATISNALASIALNETMVGSNDVLLEIMEKLAGGESNLHVITIVGMGGIGKTFLAKSTYERPLIKEHFDLRAWTTISQHYNTGEILCEVLSQATNVNKEYLSGKSEHELGSELHKYLFGRRFLIVLDDMWSIDTWDKIQRFFPKNDNGSRVLVTTRLSQLSSQLNNDYSLRMSFLDEASSWDLFSKTVFGEKSCPKELKNIGEKIVDHCRGLPLSIVVVGGLLKKMDWKQESWESIQENLSSVVNMDNNKQCLKLLKMSYNHLPVYLKPCFLYMGVFKEDDEIFVSTLVKLWVSEGFLKPTNGETLETTAKGFLQDLIDRNLILIHNLGSTGSIKSCKIHDLLRDLCMKEGQKGGFYHVMKQCNPPPQGMNTQRRVVVPINTSKKNVREEMKSMSHARSVICEYGDVPRNMGLLRILHVYKLHDFVDENYVDTLSFHHVNLRHLAIVKDGDMSSFLRSVSLLWNLHTLIVSCSHRATLLSHFWKMPQYRHIEFVMYPFHLPNAPSYGEFIIVDNLHTLKGVRNFECCERAVKRIPNIKKLRVRYDIVDDEDYCVGNIKSLSRLKSLGVTFKVRPPWSTNTHNKLTFPHSLKKLNIFVEYDLEWDYMLEKIGSLPLLEKLKLRGGCFKKGKWETAEGQFPYLKYLALEMCMGLENWTAAEEGYILPCLERLYLFDLKGLKMIPCELGNIDTLMKIQLFECGEGAVKSAKEMVDEQVELQGEDQLSFQVKVKLRRSDKHLQCLAGPNFEVIS